MAKSAMKSSPSLYYLIEHGQHLQLERFLRSASFQSMEWLFGYHGSETGDETTYRTALFEMLSIRSKGDLQPLEYEAERIRRMAESEGAYVLGALAHSRLELDEGRYFSRELVDDTARSFWCYLQKPSLFEAAEGALHVRSFRQYRKHYQRYEIDRGETDFDLKAGLQADALVTELTARLDLGPGCRIEQFEMPTEADEPAALMLLIYVPESPSSARHLRDDGVRETHYFRPPGEAIVVYTPDTRILEVCTAKSQIRYVVAETIAGVGLGQDLSSKPLTQKAYDLSRFLGSLRIDVPQVPGVVISSARLRQIDVSIFSRHVRLSLLVGKTDELADVLKSVPGLETTIAGALAVRKAAFRVDYVELGSSNAKSLDFSVTDRNTCDLQGHPDSKARMLGHQLLRHWGILQEFAAPTRSDVAAIMPELLKLYETREEKLPSSWFVQRQIDPDNLVAKGMLNRSGLVDFDVIDDGDDWSHEVAVRPVARGNVVQFVPIEGAEHGGESADPYRLFQINREWVRETILDSLGDICVSRRTEVINPWLTRCGAAVLDDATVSVYLARQLDLEKGFANARDGIAAQHDSAPAIIFCAGQSSFSRIGRNVILPLKDYFPAAGPDAEERSEAVFRAYRRSEAEVERAWIVDLRMIDATTAELKIPGEKPLQISGEVRIMVFRRLVDAFNRCKGPQKVASLLKGCASKSMNDVFKREWKHIKDVYLISSKPGSYQLSVKGPDQL